MKMKQKVENILEETGYKESRAAKMDLNDILKYVRFPFPHECANVSFVDYCRPFMTLTSISLECAVVLVVHSPLYQILFTFWTLSSCFPHHLMDGLYQSPTFGLLEHLHDGFALGADNVVLVFVQRLLVALLTTRRSE